MPPIARCAKSPAIIAIALVLVAVFVPLAFITGLSGQFYKQFALTIAISTVISAVNSLTLSPALAALLLRGHDAPPDALTRVMDRWLGWLFRGFNKVFKRGAQGYTTGVTRALGRKALMLGVYAALAIATAGLFKAVPGGFVPGQDKQYLIGFAQLPDGATLDRTEDVIRRMGWIALKHPGVKDAIAFPGLSINGFTNGSYSGIVFDATVRQAPGKEQSGRRGPAEPEVRGDPRRVHRPAPVRGPGTTGG